MKKVICKSGLTGYQIRLQKSYSDFGEFESYDEIYNLAKRLGYKDAVAAWKANPLIQGSVNPSDFRKVRSYAKQ